MTQVKSRVKSQVNSQVKSQVMFRVESQAKSQVKPQVKSQIRSQDDKSQGKSEVDSGRFRYDFLIYYVSIFGVLKRSWGNLGGSWGLSGALGGGPPGSGLILAAQDRF